MILYGSHNNWGQLNNPLAENGAVAFLLFAPLESCTVTTRAQLHRLQQRIKEMPVSHKVFSGGWAGYFSYEAGKALMNLPAGNVLLAEFSYYPMVIRLDFTSDVCEAFWQDDLPEEQVEQRLMQLQQLSTAPSDSTPATVSWRQLWNQQEYSVAFSRIQDYLQAGDCYQVNLTMPFISNQDLTRRSPYSLFQTFNPAFGGYMKTPHTTLFSVSPERFICIDNDHMETRPIKGTSARGSDEVSDIRNKEWLRNSAKNQAENLMIVDLLRNDMSFYAEPHSVRVDKLFDIETHANVHHMVSTISALKQPQHHAVDAIMAALPGGSITGAPKRRAMEIIDELEVRSRGAYCGAMGFFGNHGVSDFNILIRTIEAKPAEAVCWGGGGIVADSVGEEEWQEIFSKVKRILDTPF